MRGRTCVKRAVIIFTAVVLFVAFVLSFFAIGEKYARGIDRFVPDYEKVDLIPILSKDSLSDEDYALLYAQTGLTKIGIDIMLEEGDITKIVDFQEAFFKEYDYTDLNFAPFCHYYSLKGAVPIVPLQDGDIIISSSTEFSWWSIGHCAMVVDAANGITVEAIGIGSDSTYGYTASLSRRCDLIVLRPKIDAAKVDEIVEYVENELVGITYDPTVGVLSRKYVDDIKLTQCAHIFWYAYYKHGFDIDSNGGAVVTPKDISNSEYFDVIQVSGFDPQTLWSN